MKICFTLLFFLCSTLLWGHDYFVSIATGDDDHSGTESDPFKTIAKASSVLVAGDVCYIMEGVYREVLSPKNSGQAGLPIVYRAYNEDEVTISATEPLNDWINHSGNIYKTTVSMSLDVQNMIFFKGQNMDWARWPNNTDGDQFTINAELVTSGTASSIQSSNIPNLDWSGGYVWYLGAHCGTSWTRAITSSSSGTVNYQAVDITKWPFNPHNPTYLENKNYGF